MKATIKPIEKSRVHIIIEVPEDIVLLWRTKAVKVLSEQVKVPGFRQGKATEDVVINYLGEKAILDETVDLVIQNTYADVVKEHDIKVVARPEKVELKSIDPFTYEVIVAIYPQVKLKNYKKIKIPKEKVTVTEKEVNDVVIDMQKRYSTFTPVEREAKKGDRVLVDFEGKDEGGVVLDGTVSKNHQIIVGEGRFIPGFEEHLIGMKKGEEKDFPITFPADYHVNHMKGKKVIFHINMLGVEEVHLPDVDEEFIKKVRGENITKEAFLDLLKTDIEQYKTREQEQKRESELMEKLLTVAEVEVPDALVEEELTYMMDEYKNRIESQGIPFASFLERGNKTEESLKAEWKKDASDRVAVRLILREIIEKEKPEVSDEDLEHEIGHIVEHYPEKEQQKVKDLYASGTRQREELKNKLQVRKMIDIFLQ
jgi:trigger factor